MYDPSLEKDWWDEMTEIGLEKAKKDAPNKTSVRIKGEGFVLVEKRSGRPRNMDDFDI